MAPMGFLLPCLQTFNTPLGPPSKPEEFLFAYFCKKKLKITPKGGGVIPQIFCRLKPHLKCQNPGRTPSGRKVTGSIVVTKF